MTESLRERLALYEETCLIHEQMLRVFRGFS